jgi:hypothetical protein
MSGLDKAKNVSSEPVIAPTLQVEDVYAQTVSTKNLIVEGSAVLPDGAVDLTNYAYMPSTQLGFRNKIINGSVIIDQRGSATTPVVGTGYSADRWFFEDGCDAVFSTGQSTDVPKGQGFSSSIKSTVTTANTSVTTNEFSVLSYFIEGTDSASFAWGGTGAKAITASFWVKSSVAGTYSFTLYNNGASRIYPASYTVNIPNTWEKKIIQIPGDTAGTWLTTNGRGVVVNFYTSLASNFLGLSTWNSSGIYGVVGQVNAAAAVGNTFTVTGLQIEEGVIATPFEHRPIGTELALCQRYYYNHTPGSSAQRAIGVGTWFTATQMHIPIKFPVSMRIKPILVMPSSAGYYISYQNSTSTSISGLTLETTVTTTEQAEIYNTGLTSSTIGPALFRTNNASGNVAFNSEL